MLVLKEFTQVAKKLNNLEITKSVHKPKEMMMIAINVLIFGVSLINVQDSTFFKNFGGFYWRKKITVSAGLCFLSI